MKSAPHRGLALLDIAPSRSLGWRFLAATVLARKTTADLKMVAPPTKLDAKAPTDACARAYFPLLTLHVLHGAIMRKLQPPQAALSPRPPPSPTEAGNRATWRARAAADAAAERPIEFTTRGGVRGLDCRRLELDPSGLRVRKQRVSSSK